MRRLGTGRTQSSRAAGWDKEASTLGNDLSNVVDSNGQRARKHVKHAVRPAVGNTLRRRQADREHPEIERRIDNTAEMASRQYHANRICGLRLGESRQRQRREDE